MYDNYNNHVLTSVTCSFKFHNFMSISEYVIHVLTPTIIKCSNLTITCGVQNLHFMCNNYDVLCAFHMYTNPYHDVLSISNFN